MKKQIKKLSLNKKTISNLDAIQMKNIVGGDATRGANCNTKKNTCWCTATCRGSGCITCF
jgi:natural product precursor